MTPRLLTLVLIAGCGLPPALAQQMNPVPAVPADDLQAQLVPATDAPAQAPATDAAADATTLDTILVRARVQSLYKTEDSSMATRTDTPLQLVPQAIQIIPEQLIEDQAAMEVTDLYRNISGVSFFSYSGVTMRGFRQDDALYDGLRGDPYAGFAVPRLFSVNEVQVLKGASGSTYGESDPGGVINYTSKKPTHSQQNLIKLRVGDDDFHSTSVESSGPIGLEKRWRYRVGAHVDGEHGYRYNTERDTRIGEAAIETDIGDRGGWLLQVTDIAQDLPGNRLRGVLVSENGQFLTTRRWNAAERDDYLKHHAQAVYSRLTLAPTDALDLNFAARWFRNQERQRYHEPRGLDDGGRTVNREFRDQKRWNRGLSTNANAVLRFDTGALAHRLLLGGEYYWRYADLDSRTADSADEGGPVRGLDLFDPQYGLTGFEDYGFDDIPFNETRDYLKNLGVYLQDQISIGERWNLLAGLRWERLEREDRDAGEGISAEDLTWRTGITYAVVPSTNVYATTGTSFKPQTQMNYPAASRGVSEKPKPEKPSDTAAPSHCDSYGCTRSSVKLTYAASGGEWTRRDSTATRRWPAVRFPRSVDAPGKSAASRSSTMVRSASTPPSTGSSAAISCRTPDKIPATTAKTTMSHSAWSAAKAWSWTCWPMSPAGGCST